MQAKQSMTSWQRVDAAVALQIPDRVPVIINGEAHFAKLAGLTPTDVVGPTDRPPFNVDKAERAFRTAWEKYGGWDAVWLGPLFYLLYSGLCPPFSATREVRLPGVDYPADSQAHLELIEDPPMMDENGYDLLLEEGFIRFLNLRKMGIVTTFFRPFILSDKLVKIFEYWYERKVPWWGMGRTSTPIEIFSYMRGLRWLTDIHRRRDKIKQAADMIVDGLIAGALISARANRKYSNMMMIECHRGGNTYFSPRIFSEIYLPYLKKMVNSFTNEGFNVFLHLDSSYDLNLEYFRELPKGRVVLELDGTTDIVKAKRILGDCCCIKGDVPATLLELGSARDVENYCKKLIDVVGEGGGFILSNACEIPVNAKFENVKTLLNTAKTYGVYRK